MLTTSLMSVCPALVLKDRLRQTGREAAPLQLCLALTSGKVTMRDLKAEYDTYFSS